VDEEGSRELPPEERDPEEVPEDRDHPHGRQEDGEPLEAGGNWEPGHASRLEGYGDRHCPEEVKEEGEPGGELEAQVGDHLHDLEEGGHLLEADLVPKVEVEPGEEGSLRGDPFRREVEEDSQDDEPQDDEDRVEEGRPASGEALGAPLSHRVVARGAHFAEVVLLVPPVQALPAGGTVGTGFAGEPDNPFPLPAHVRSGSEAATHRGRLAPREEGFRGCA